MKPIKLLVVLAMLSHCKTKSQSTMKDVDANSNEIAIIVFSGGFDSCPNGGVADSALNAAKTPDMYSHFKKLGFTKVIKGESPNQPLLFFSCYTGVSQMYWDYAEKISGRFAWNQSDLSIEGKLGVKSFDVIQGELLNSVAFLSHIKFELQKTVKELESEGKKVKMHFFGHSYGGFTAIQLADTFLDHLASIVTIDPVSMLDCQARSMLLEPAKTVTMQHKGCLQYPDDKFSEKSTTSLIKALSIKDSKIRWLHYYQDMFPFLHSGPLPIGRYSNFPQTLNFSDFPNKEAIRDYHSLMANSEILWKKVYKDFDRFNEL